MARSPLVKYFFSIFGIHLYCCLRPKSQTDKVTAAATVLPNYGNLIIKAKGQQNPKKIASSGIDHLLWMPSYSTQYRWSIMLNLYFRLKAMADFHFTKYCFTADKEHPAHCFPCCVDEWTKHWFTFGITGLSAMAGVDKYYCRQLWWLFIVVGGLMRFSILV